MAMKTALVVVGAGAIVSLQGCGGGSTTTPAPPAPGPTPAPSTSPAPGPAPGPATLVTTEKPVTTTLPPQPSAPLSGADAAAMMNDEYKAFDSTNADGSIGTFIRITGATKVYCHDGCHSGWADCRVSGSVYNPKQIINADTGAIEWTFTGTGGTGDYLGYWVNQTLIKQRLGKCAYTGDGGTDNKYNMGCGKRAACTSNNCTDRTCAYAARDPATDYSTYINGDSEVVAGAMMGAPGCDPGTCGYKGPAFWKETGLVPDETFQAWKWRADHDPSAHWNEYILDGEMMKEALAYNPAGTIPAIVYASAFPGGADAGKAAAKAMAQTFATEWNMDTPVPVIKVDLDVNARDGGSPFKFEDTASELFV